MNVIICWAFVSTVYALDKNLDTHVNFKNIFRNKFCDMTCNGKPHTLCAKYSKPNKRCMVYSKISEAEKREMKMQLIYAHNGVRNRVAAKMQVANMMELLWDENLAEMASRWMLTCSPFENDPCTTLSQTHIDHVNHNHNRLNVSKKLDSYCFVAQNRYYDSTVHYPITLVENAMRTWYNQRDLLKKPVIRYDHIKRYNAGRLEGENNFTHLALPELKWFGCDFSRIRDGFFLVCNYHPYMRDAYEHFRFIRGAPGSMCPIDGPLHNTKGIFSNICIGMKTNLLLTNRGPDVLLQDKYYIRQLSFIFILTIHYLIS